VRRIDMQIFSDDKEEANENELDDLEELGEELEEGFADYEEEEEE